MTILMAALLLAAGLPDYRPSRQVSGTLRSRGNDQMAALMKLWEKGFRRYQPRIQFEDTLKGTASGIYGLEMRTADIALMGRAMNPFEYYGTYERSWVYPVQIEVATGSYQTEHKSPALAVFVHKDNPVAKLTLKQLDGIFGAQRGGGWKALSWDESSARSSAEDLRNWAQLGWSDQPIHVYGPPLQGAGAITFFQARVLGGGDMWNEDLREYADRRQMIAELSKDPYGIAYAALDYAAPGVKTLPLAETGAGPFVKLTRTSVADRSYPLSRPVYVVFTIDDEKSEIRGPDPKVREFLRYVLSKQGQEDVARQEAYLPLTSPAVRAQLARLQSKEIPAERKVIGAEAGPAKVRMSIDEDPIVLRLARSLGYLEAEGVEIVSVDLEKRGREDYLMQEPLTKGEIDASYHWFNHAIYGARHGYPVQAVMLFNDAPGITVLVADRLRDEIHGAADFKGRRVAEGAGYGTKSAITGYLARRAGLPPGSYRPVMLEKEGRQEAVIEGLKQGAVEVMTFQEPITSALLATGMVSPLYDLNSRGSTARALGAAFPAQSLLVAPRYAAEHPEVVQKLVNALVRTMRFLNSHSAEEIAATLPPDYFTGKDRRGALDYIRATLPTYARGDYSFSPAAVKLAIDVNLTSSFDQSEEGRWRAGGDSSRIRAEELYTNLFVLEAQHAP